MKLSALRIRQRMVEKAIDANFHAAWPKLVPVISSGIRNKNGSEKKKNEERGNSHNDIAQDVIKALFVCVPLQYSCKVVSSIACIL